MDVSTMETGVDLRTRNGSLAVNLGLAANVLLALLKTTIGIMGHSPALLADGVNSTSDVAYYIVVAVFMRLSRKPADREHPFGHSQLETIAALTVGSFVITTAIAIFWDAVSTTYDQLIGNEVSVGAAPIALWVALFTVVLKIGLTVYTNQLGRQTKNPAVVALAYDHRNDVFSAGAATIGILLGRLGHPWVDPLAGALVALVILRTGIEILRDSTSELMDTVPGDSLEEDVRSVLATIPEVLKVDDIHAHRFGPYLVINLTIGVDGSMSVTRGDRVATKVEQALYQNIDFLKLVHVHFHPAQT
jgi:cation diffusion facilitator family transporter